MFVDIHSHILPGYDDGAVDKETALSMLKIAAENLTGHIIATPHFIPGKSQIHPQSISNSCRELQALAYENGLDLKIYPGCEVFISPELPHLYDLGLICTLGDSRYMLIELPMMSIPPYTETVLYNLQLKGLIPILAHPERSRELMKNSNILREMARRGILIQINSSSLSGIHGKEIKEFARQLLDEGLVHFIASDAHSIRNRRPDLSTSASFVKKKYGIKAMRLLLHENGLAILENRLAQSPEIANKKRGILRLLSGRLNTKFSHIS